MRAFTTGARYVSRRNFAAAVSTHFRVKTLNAISGEGLKRLPSDRYVASPLLLLLLVLVLLLPLPLLYDY